MVQILAKTNRVLMTLLVLIAGNSSIEQSILENVGHRNCCLRGQPTLDVRADVVGNSVGNDKFSHRKYNG